MMKAACTLFAATLALAGVSGRADIHGACTEKHHYTYGREHL